MIRLSRSATPGQLRRIQEEDGDARKVLSLRHAADEDLADAEQALLERDEENWLPILYGLTAFFGDDPVTLKKSTFGTKACGSCAIPRWAST